MRAILCAVDLSTSSRPALKMAVALSRTFGARLYVIEAMDTSVPVLPNGQSLAGPMPAALRDAAQRHLDQFVRAARPSGIDVTAAAIEGPTVDTILRRARTLRADLLVTGTHGRTGFRRFAFGSIAEKVVREAECPVLVVPPGSRIPPLPFRTVVCGVDFEPASLDGVAYAGELIAPRGRLVLAHAIDWPFGAETAQSPIPIRTLRESLERTAALQLRRAGRRIDRPDVRLEEEVGIGKPYEHVLRSARKYRADLIVMGPHGRASIRLALLGSTTHQVIRDAPCPVLTVRGAARRRPGGETKRRSGGRGIIVV